jgi:hypothetical protein
MRKSLRILVWNPHFFERKLRPRLSEGSTVKVLERPQWQIIQ